MEQMGQLSRSPPIGPISATDFACNWVADFLLGREHLTKFEQALSSVLAINASIIQGSDYWSNCLCH